MADNSKHAAYFLLRKRDDEKMQNFAFGSSDYVDKVKQRWIKGDGATEEGISEDLKTEVSSKNVQPDFTHASALTDALSASVDFGLAQHELIQAAMLAPVLMRIVHIQFEVIKPISEVAEKLSDDADATLFGLNEAQYTDLVRRKDKYELSKKGMERFPTAILLSIVATFDTLMIDVLSKLLRLQTDWLERSDRTISLGRLSKATNLEEIIGEQLSEEMYQFSRGSHSDQVDYIKKNFGVDIVRDWKRWPDYVEIFERRNLVAHGEPSFNKRYVSICQKAGHKGCDDILGSEIKITREYLKQSLDILIEFSVLLSFSLFRKFVKENEDQAFTNLNEAVFKLIKGGHHLVAERISKYALDLQKVKITSETRLMLLVNQASALRHLERVDEARKVLDANDWSAVSDIFKICVAAVRGDVNEFIKYMKYLKLSGGLRPELLLEWPCFSFMLNDVNAREAISEEFSLDLLGGTTEVLAKEAEEDEK